MKVSFAYRKLLGRAEDGAYAEALNYAYLIRLALSRKGVARIKARRHNLLKSRAQSKVAVVHHVF